MGRGPGRPKTPAERSELLAVARRAFAERGYAGASLSTIANAAGMRKSSLLHHFGSKDKLYGEVLGTVLADLQRLLPEPGQPWPAALDRLGAELTDYFAAHREAARLLVRELAGGPMPDSVGVQVVEGALHGTAWFLRRGMDEGHVPRQDPMQLGMSIIGLHLTWFAAAEVSAIAAGGDVFSPEAVEARKEAVLAQVRRLVGLPT
jgi:AcrR family transcriptional regulator